MSKSTTLSQLAETQAVMAVKAVDAKRVHRIETLT